jgi:hypothetical protein
LIVTARSSIDVLRRAKCLLADHGVITKHGTM